MRTAKARASFQHAIERALKQMVKAGMSTDDIEMVYDKGGISKGLSGELRHKGEAVFVFKAGFYGTVYKTEIIPVSERAAGI